MPFRQYYRSVALALASRNHSGALLGAARYVAVSCGCMPYLFNDMASIIMPVSAEPARQSTANNRQQPFRATAEAAVARSGEMRIKA